MCVEMKAREVKIVAAHRRVSLTLVSSEKIGKQFHVAVAIGSSQSDAWSTYKSMSSAKAIPASFIALKACFHCR
jgi:hypothetical protein